MMAKRLEHKRSFVNQRLQWSEKVAVATTVSVQCEYDRIPDLFVNRVRCVNQHLATDCFTANDLRHFDPRHATAKIFQFCSGGKCSVWRAESEKN